MPGISYSNYIKKYEKNMKMSSYMKKVIIKALF